LHLLTHAWIPSLGISAWWTLFMLNVHPFWSIGVSIALAEGLFPPPADPNQSPVSTRTPVPWLGKIGLSIAAILFIAGCAFNTHYQFRHDPFRATHAQFLISAFAVVAFIAAAFLIPPPTPSSNPSPVPSPWIIGGATFLLGAAVMLPPLQWDWLAVAWTIGLRLFSQCSAWTPLHTLSVGAGGALLYGVHAFLQPPVVPCPRGVVLPSHILFLTLAIAVIALAVRRTCAANRRFQEPSGP
jgi:magnesium-transporting ATPase (P-type)